MCCREGGRSQSTCERALSPRSSGGLPKNNREIHIGSRCSVDTVSSCSKRVHNCREKDPHRKEKPLEHSARAGQVHRLVDPVQNKLAGRASHAAQTGLAIQCPVAWKDE